MKTKNRIVKKISFLAPALVAGAISFNPAVFASTNDVLVLGGMHAKVFAQGSTSMIKPDDITKLGDHIFVGFQNGVHSKGGASNSGQKSSTIVEYNLRGNRINQWSIIGKADGLSADSQHNDVVATVNEDGNSSIYVIRPDAPKAQQVKHFTFNVDPTKLPAGNPLAWGGGTDSIAFANGHMLISASAPSPDNNGNFVHAAVVEATLKGDTAILKPSLMGNAKAIDMTTGKSVKLNLSDPDSSNVVPKSSNQFAGDFMLDSQGDSELVFVHNPGTSQQTVKRLQLGTQVNDVEWATSSTGTLYVTDNGANKIYAISGHFTPNTVFAASPGDSGVAGFVGTVDLTGGTIHPFAIGFKSPAGLLFVPNN